MNAAIIIDSVCSYLEMIKLPMVTLKRFDHWMIIGYLLCAFHERRFACSLRPNTVSKFTEMDQSKCDV